MVVIKARWNNLNYLVSGSSPLAQVIQDVNGAWLVYTCGRDSPGAAGTLEQARTRAERLLAVYFGRMNPPMRVEVEE